jgi:Tfp pilus assembly protein PilF
MSRRRTLRWATVVVAITAIAMLGAVLRWHELGQGEGIAVVAAPEPSIPRADTDHAEAVARRFRQGVVMLHAREYEHAALAFEHVLMLAPRLPEARVNMGYAMLGQGRARVARDYFRAAIDERPSQRNAYYGLAEALEALGDTAGALGAMRTFVHLSPAGDPFVPKARAALWEWQAAMAVDRERPEGRVPQ